MCRNIITLVTTDNPSAVKVKYGRRDSIHGNNKTYRCEAACRRMRGFAFKTQVVVGVEVEDPFIAHVSPSSIFVNVAPGRTIVVAGQVHKRDTFSSCRQRA